MAFLCLSAFASHCLAADSRIITLEQAYDLTLASDQSIQRAYWEIQNANLEPWSALSRLGPSINGSSSLARSEQTTRSNATSAAVFDNATSSPASARRDTRTLGLSFQQTLFDLTAIPAYRVGKLTARAARLTYQSTIRQVLFGVAQAYYAVLKQQRVVVVSADTLKLAQQQFDLAKARAHAGEVTRSDVLRAQVTVESDRRILIESQNTLASARNTLANILNLDTEAPLGVVEPEPYSASDNDFESLLARAMSNREDLRVRALAIDQDIQRRYGVMAEYAPRVVAQMNNDYNSVSSSADSRTHSWDATLSVQMPFLTGGQREIDLRRAGNLVAQTRLDYEILAKQIQQQVKDAWLQARTLSQTIDATRVQVAAAQQAYEDIRNQYQAGSATSVDVLSSLNDLNVARRDLAAQTYDYQVALRNLEQATGVFQTERVDRVKFR